MLFSRVVFFAAVAALLVVSVSARDGEGCGACRLKKFSVNDEIEAEVKGGSVTEAARRGQCVNIPYEDLNEFVRQPRSWCTWNARFGQVENDELRVGEKLTSQLNILPKGWKQGESTLLKVHSEPGFSEYAWKYNHNGIFGKKHIAVGELDERRSCLMTWEKAAGHESHLGDISDVHLSFQNAAEATAAGTKCLELVFEREGKKLDYERVKKHCHRYTNFACEKKEGESVHSLDEDLFFSKHKHTRQEL